MSPHCQFRRLGRIASIVCLCLAAPSVHLFGQTEVHEQFWPEANIFIRTSQETRVFLLASATRDLLSGPVDAQVGAHFDVALPPFIRELFTEYDNEVAPFQYLFARVGVRYFETRDDATKTLDDSNRAKEIRALIELTPREVLFEHFLLAWRHRMEFRWVNDQFFWRYRTRLWLERTFFMTEELSLTPYIASELFFDSRADASNRTRTMAGLRFGALHWLAPEVNVGYQHDWDIKSSKTYFISGILNFYF